MRIVKKYARYRAVRHKMVEPKLKTRKRIGLLRLIPRCWNRIDKLYLDLEHYINLRNTLWNRIKFRYENKT